MTEHDINVARDIGGLQADMRTVKHELNNVSSKIDASQMIIMNEMKSPGGQITALKADKARGLGFIGGVTAVLGVFAAIATWLVSHIPGVRL